MVVLSNFAAQKESMETWRVVLLFGIGLIGQAVLGELLRRSRFDIQLWFYNWYDPQQQQAQLNNLLTQLHNQVTYSTNGRIDLIWSAGKGGFSSLREELVQELASFNRVLECAKELTRIFPQATHTFHLLSSAGGLFEGQIGIGLNSLPAPLRPYAELKLHQEERLLTLPAQLIKRIYRPSSVYGFAYGARKGLITTLIENGLAQRVSKIFGQMDTLRDYVLCDDIGRFIAKQIIASSIASSTPIMILASGRAATISEIKYRIENVLGRHIYVYYQAESIAAHNSYRQEIFPPGWQATDLTIGIRQVYHQLMNPACSSLLTKTYFKLLSLKSVS